MFKAVNLLAVALLAIPAISHANTPTRAKTAHARSARHARHTGRARAVARPVSLQAVSSSAPVSRTATREALARTDAPMPTSLSHSFGRSGAFVGSLGYNHVDYVDHLDRSEVAAAAHISDASTVLGAELFFYSRLAHAALYLAGVPFIRPLAWAGSVAGTIMVLMAILGLT